MTPDNHDITVMWLCICTPPNHVSSRRRSSFLLILNFACNVWFVVHPYQLRYIISIFKYMYVYMIAWPTLICQQKRRYAPRPLTYLRSSRMASCQTRKIASCACAGNAGNVFPATDFKRNRLLAIPACITARASRTCRDSCPDRKPAVAGKRSRHSRRMRNLQFYVSGKRPMPVISQCTANDLKFLNNDQWTCS